ncbi:MAG: hypothetical protein V1926_02900 [Candidatus Peregrinibacteria bacterium]
MPACKQCSSAFEITKDDLAFYEKVSPVFNGKKELIPPPTLCPECRWQQRFTWRNDRKLYHRKCDLTGKQIISIYAAEKPFKVYEQRAWWGDTWDPGTAARPYDFSRPFFEQFSSLLHDVPIPSLHTESCENAEYGNYNWGVKDSYLVFASDQSQDCFYSHLLFGCHDCMDCSYCKDCQYCYQLLDSEKCYRCFYSKELTNCDTVDFSFDCKKCRHCFGCAGLRNKAYHLFNEAVSEEEYASKLRELTLTDSAIGQARARAIRLWQKLPRLAAHLLQCEECTGDNLAQCKNCRECFDGTGGRDCVRMQNIPGNTKDCHEIYGAGYAAELSYQGYCIAAQRTLFSFLVYPSGSNVLYSAYCRSSQHLFGCIGLAHKQYCILNTQYTKEEYEELMPKIIEHMRKSGEYGEFFPAAYSPFAYNESIAQDFFPLSREEAVARGFSWREENEQANYLGPVTVVPSTIGEADDAICAQILRCSVTAKPYKIIPQELKFYREMGIPLPRICPDQRHKERLAQRNPRKLWSRNCAKCGRGIETTYAPERPETVYCESCYLSSVY